MDHLIDAEAGTANMFSKSPKRIIAWISKAWTPYEKQSLPIFYKETIATLLTFEQWRNLVETQEEGHGITCYSDHLPGIKNASLSNTGKLHGDFTPLVCMTYACPARMTESGHLRISASRRSFVLYSIPIERSHDNGCTLPSQNFEIRTPSPYWYP